MRKKTTKKTPNRAVSREEAVAPMPEQKAPEKPLKDAKITVLVEFPGKEPFSFGFAIPNAQNAVVAPKQREMVFRQAMYKGLRGEYGGIVKVQ